MERLSKEVRAHIGDVCGEEIIERLDDKHSGNKDPLIFKLCGSDLATFI
jgi:hypothetical protein